MTKSCRRRHFSLIQLLVRPYVDRVRLLADQALELQLAGVVEYFLRAAGQVVAEPDVFRILKNPFQFRLAFAQRQLAHVLAVEERRVEHVVDDLRVGAGVERVLQRLEAGAAVGSRHHDLAVEPRVFQAELLHRLGEVRQLGGPVVAASGE